MAGSSETYRRGNMCSPFWVLVMIVSWVRFDAVLFYSTCELGLAWLGPVNVLCSVFKRRRCV